MLARTLLEDHVLLYRGDSGQVVALHDRCPHRGALLSKGRREGDSVRCMYHGIRYDATGKCTQIPGQDMIPPKLRVRSYPIVERNHLIFRKPASTSKHFLYSLIVKHDDDPSF